MGHGSIACRATGTDYQPKLFSAYACSDLQRRRDRLGCGTFNPGTQMISSPYHDIIINMNFDSLFRFSTCIDTAVQKEKLLLQGHAQTSFSSAPAVLTKEEHHHRFLRLNQGRKPSMQPKICGATASSAKKQKPAKQGFVPVCALGIAPLERGVCAAFNHESSIDYGQPGSSFCISGVRQLFLALVASRVVKIPVRRCPPSGAA